MTVFWAQRAPPAGATAQNVGSLMLSGDHLVFRHFGHGPLTTSSKRKLFSSLYPIPSPLLLVSDTKGHLRTLLLLPYLTLAWLKQPKSRVVYY